MDKVLQRLLDGDVISNQEHYDLREYLKPVFFRQGFMDWHRAKSRDAAKERLGKESLRLLDQNELSCDELVVTYSSLANTHNQGTLQKALFSVLDSFPNWPASGVEGDLRVSISQLQAALTCQDPKRLANAALLVASYAEQSNTQARKSQAGVAGEYAVELVLMHAGLERGSTYGAQFIHQGSNTDFIVPYAESGSVTDVRAYIAVQMSSNDRTRLSSSELHTGGVRFFCSLNGCTAASKNTNDIGDDLIAGAFQTETYYVVVQKELDRAIAHAEKRLKKLKGRAGATNAQFRLRWLTERGINYDQFADRLLELV
ncbi:hypothetical protein [Marinobacter alexandrii]|uniref:hypothetical protein n=1 Tax=Marinobacter alexandrii TaxID=2570351 RepID=UPI003297DED4